MKLVDRFMDEIANRVIWPERPETEYVVGRRVGLRYEKSMILLDTRLAGEMGGYINFARADSSNVFAVRVRPYTIDPADERMKPFDYLVKEISVVPDQLEPPLVKIPDEYYHNGVVVDIQLVSGQDGVFSYELWNHPMIQ